MAERPWAWLMCCLMWTGPVWGMSAVANVDCPLQVKATAQEVREPEGADHAFAKRKVVFAVDEALKGEASEALEVELLKHGPTQVETGRQYLVQLNQGRLCWIEAL